MSFTGTIIVGLALVARFGSATAVRIVARAAAIVVIVSAAAAILIPSFGVHQVDEAFDSVNAGLWRGVVSHKNNLGHLAAVSLVLSTFCGRGIFGLPLFRWCTVGASLLCLVFARSAGAFAVGALMALTYFIIRSVKPLPALARAAVFTFGLGVLVPVALSLHRLAELGLAVLGRDATITGRTQLWSLISRIAFEHPVLGTGYAAGFAEIRPTIYLALGWLPPNAHSAYLDIFLGLGAVGLVLFIYVIVRFAFLAGRIALEGASGDSSLSYAPTILFVFVAAFGSYESSIILGRDFHAIIFATAYAACCSAHFQRSWELGAYQDPVNTR